MSSITIAGLTQRFDKVVLQDVDLTVESGEVTAILGASGTGKSTLLRCVAGLLRPDGGEIWLGGELVEGPRVHVPTQRRKVGLVPQEGALFPHLSVADNIGFGLRGRDRDARIAELLDIVGLAGTARMRPHELSGGMQQRVAVARALAPRPSVILLDEPFSALDAGLRDDVRQDVFAVIRADGATALLVTHDQQEAFAVADRVAVMMDGTIAQHARPEQVYLEPASLAVARFVGETVVLPTGAGRTVLGDVPAPDGPGAVVFRPEDLNLQSGHLLGDGVVSGIRFHGHDSLVSVDIGGQTVLIRGLGAAPVRVGDMTRVYASRRGVFFPA